MEILDGAFMRRSDAFWLKGKGIIRSLLGVYDRSAKEGTPALFNFKELERGRGFLVHLSMTYPDMVPYLKGIHLTLDSWRKDRKADGWKLRTEEEWIQFLIDRKYSKVESF